MFKSIAISTLPEDPEKAEDTEWVSSTKFSSLPEQPDSADLPRRATLLGWSSREAVKEYTPSSMLYN